MWKNEMDTETPAGLNEICKVFVVRYLVLVGFGMYNKFCMYRGKSWKYQMRKTDITICE